MSHTVLLADDDAAIRMVLNQALTRAGYEVRPTGNLSTMWNWVSRGEGDLLITDVMMPDGNAFDIMPKVKKLRPDLPVVVMSAQNTFMIRAYLAAARNRHRGQRAGHPARPGADYLRSVRDLEGERVRAGAGARRQDCRRPRRRGRYGQPPRTYTLPHPAACRCTHRRAGDDRRGHG